MEEKVLILNSKGLKLSSIIYSPDQNKKYPAIILLYGFTGYKEEAHLEELARLLMKSGYAVIRFDVSGSGESEGTFEEDYLMSNYLEDIKNVYNYILKLKFVDKNRIGIVGHSMGGLLSIVFASKQPEVKACIAISSPTILVAANWIKAAVKEWERVGWLYRETTRDGRHIKIPFSFIVDANKFNALDFVSRVHCPIAIVLGLSDDVVSPNDTRNIFQIANEPKELIEIEGVGHDYKKYPDLIEKVNEKVLGFLRGYL